jgi:uncharacterized membrane protein (DUF441 family)
MDSFILPSGVAEMGPWGITVSFGVLIIVSVVKGWLVPKTLHESMLSSATARAVAAEAANERLSERAAKLTETNSVLAKATANNAAVGDTVTKLVDAIQAPRATVSGGSE